MHAVMHIYLVTRLTTQLCKCSPVRVASTPQVTTRIRPYAHPQPDPSEPGGRGSQLGHMPTAGPGDAELSRDLAPLLGRVEQRQQGEAAAAKKAGARACQGGTAARKGAASQPAERVQQAKEA